MFTGIIEEIGEVLGLYKDISSNQILISANRILEDIKPGDSIAVNGACLTVYTIKNALITADIAPETINCTALGNYSKGTKVNLERAMKLNDRLGGHIVTGHIDSTARLEFMKSEYNAELLKFSISPKFMKYITKKGSIAIDGISLTIADRTDDTFIISVIPFTLQNSTLKYRNSGDIVNVECDIIGKYVENLLLSNKINNSTLTTAKLMETGFLK